MSEGYIVVKLWYITNYV